MDKKKRKDKRAFEVSEEFIKEDSLNVDPQGSYTGKPEDKKEKPLQDADDL